MADAPSLPSSTHLETTVESVLMQFSDSRRFFRALFDDAPYGVFVTRADGRVAACNRKVADLLGYTIDEITGRHFNEFTVPEDHGIGPEIIRAIVSGQSSHFSLDKRYIHRNGQTIWVHLNLGVIRNATGLVEFFVAAIDDVTREHHQKEALLESEKRLQALLEGQSEVLRQISTPLMPIADGVMAMPLVGPVDRARAQQMLTTLMDGITKHATHTVIIDITGVPNVDAEVAELLAQATRVVQLLGAEALFAGIRPDVARNIIALGIDLHSFKSAGSFQAAIAMALRHHRKR